MDTENKTRAIEAVLPIRGVGEKSLIDIYNKFSQEYLEVVDLIG